MNLLGSVLYDPAVAVTKATTAAAVMAAMDTTNLRIAFTIPAHGKVRVRLAGTVHGATTFPTILLGVMDGSNIRGRMAPVQSLGNTAVATAFVSVEAEFTVSGLTPGAVSWDAAWATETGIAATGIKYGGPNDTTANNAFGGFCFEVWDPQPLTLALGGGVNVSQISGDTTAADNAESFFDGTGYAGTNNVIPTVTTATNLTNAPTVGDFTAAMKASITAAVPTAAVIAAAVWDRLTSALTTVGSIGKLLVDNINATISSRSSHSAADVWAVATRLLTAGTNIVLAKGTGVTGFNDLSAAQVNTEADTALTDYGALKPTTGGRTLDVTAANKVAGVVLVDTLTTYTGDTPQTGDTYALANGVNGFVATKADTAAILVDTGTTLDSKLDSTLADTNELQTDWANGGRLDLILDARASQASVDTVDGIVDAIKLSTDNLPSDPADQSLIIAATNALATLINAMVAPDNAGIAAIQAKTDQLTFTVAGQADVNLESVNGTEVTGAGTPGDPWGT